MMIKIILINKYIQFGHDGKDEREYIDFHHRSN